MGIRMENTGRTNKWMNKMAAAAGVILTALCVSFWNTTAAGAAEASLEVKDRLSTSVTYGDVNGDGSINAEDALEALKGVVHMKELDETACVCADVNADGLVSARDALLMLQYSAKIIDNFPAVPFSGRLWICGDSIAAIHGKSGYERPLYGWGEVIDEYFNKSFKVVDYGQNSASTKSYYNDGKGEYYRNVYSSLKPNDCVIISFGHNDHNETVPSRLTSAYESTDTRGSYKWYLKNVYIDPALEKGVVPILMTSVVRCTYDGDGRFTEEDVHMAYGKAMHELVDEYAQQGIRIPIIDAQQYTYDLYSTLTYEEARLYHGLFQPGKWYFDYTHYSYAGARMICDYITSELAEMPLKLNTYRCE